MLLFFIDKIKRNFLIALFSLGKIVSATGQTIFNVQAALSYIFKNISLDPINIIAGIAGSCTLLIILITRVPAIHLQFRPQLKQNSFFSLNSSDYHYKKTTYYILVFFNIAAGIFSSIGAYLGSITIVEYLSHVFHYPIYSSQGIVFTQVFAMIVALSSFVSYYSFNIQKAKFNSIKFIEKINQHSFNFINKHFLKVFMVSFLNVASMPFIAYFLTKHALYKVPYINTFFSAHHITWIAAFSALTALIASLTTNVAAMHDYFNANEKENDLSTFWTTLRYMTYTTGLVDSSANGLGNFLGVVTISHDVFNISLYNDYVIFIAIGCGISATLLNLAFSVRQGFNDVVERYQPKVFAT